MPWSGERAWKREVIAKRAALEIEPHTYVNIGVGIPTMVSNFVTQEGVTFHSENGIIGLGGYPDDESKIDRECINASWETVVLAEGAACIDSSTSFAIIRGGHLDLTILAGMEVS